jgi:hypothetical protein
MKEEIIENIGFIEDDKAKIGTTEFSVIFNNKKYFTYINELTYEQYLEALDCALSSKNISYLKAGNYILHFCNLDITSIMDIPKEVKASFSFKIGLEYVEIYESNVKKN